MPLVHRARDHKYGMTELWKPWWSGYPKADPAKYREGDVWCTFWTHQYYKRVRSPHWVWISKAEGDEYVNQRDRERYPI